MGVGWEAGLIRRLLYKKKLRNDRIFPILFESSDRPYVPIELEGYDRFLLNGQPDYEALLRKVLERPLYTKPETGTPPDLPAQATAPLFARPVDPSSTEPASEPPAAQHTAPVPPKRIARSRLLDLGVADRFDELVGREDERRLLVEAWDKDTPRILIFVAEGGVGKTSLVADWMTGFATAGWDGVDAFFDWSFYSQGTREQSASNSGQFIDAALRHFGETGLADSPATADLKADRLAERVAGGRTLLVLDGVEPLQHPRRRGGMEGRFKDTGLERLLKRLAQLPAAGGLCVVTTRVPVVDLNRYHGGTVQQVDLAHLSEPATARLLHQAGARRAGAAAIAPDDRELLAAARELGGHALAAQLLGGYLKHARGGDIRCRDRVDWSRAFDREQEGHAAAVMAAYERWFEQHGETGRRQLAVLRLLSLFDRPAGADSLDALRGGRAKRSVRGFIKRILGSEHDGATITGLTEPLAGLDDEGWHRTLTGLADEHRLISLLRPVGRIEQVDAHPLVREYFASRLRQGHHAAWFEGHRRLYEHLCATSEQRPDTLEGLQSLYQAVAHGCRAGLHQRACFDVYVDRILRGAGSDGFYSSKKLGAIGADLGAVACFFEQPWSRPSSNLSAPDRAWLLNQAAFRLRALGRLTEAVEPMRAGLEMRIEQEDWVNAARSTGSLSELELTLGEVSAAIADAGQSVAFADRRGDEVEGMNNRTTHADALHQSGQPDESRRLFAEAEIMQVERQPEYRQLYSLQGFRYCDLLLSSAERAAWQLVVKPDSHTPNLEFFEDACDQVTERATQTLQWVRGKLGLLNEPLDHLTLGCATLYRALFTANRAMRSSDSGVSDTAIQVPQSAIAHLAAAVNGFRRSGDMTFLPRGLLTRAWQRQLTGDPSGAASDLNEAAEIAERGPMPLYQADILLTRARLFGPRHDASEYPWGSPQDDLAEARRLIERHGYHRRDQELADAEAAMRRWHGS